MDKYDEAYEVIVHVAKAKMLMNSHKGNIEDLEIGDLIAMCRTEIDELDIELAKIPIDSIKAIEEAADVLNYMIAAVHRSINRYRGRKNDQNSRCDENGTCKKMEHRGNKPTSDLSGAPIFGSHDFSQNSQGNKPGGSNSTLVDVGADS